MGMWADEVILKWSNEDVKINIGASTKEIAEAESILDFIFPYDFKQLYIKMNGFLDLDWQEHMFYFWPLERIIEEFNDRSDKSFIGFCDFLLASSYIGFKKDEPGIFKSYSINDVEPISIAANFEEVVAMINTSSDLIY
jgi:hypothetical protein